MKKPITANLNDKYILQICDSNTEGALNGWTFEANADWVLCKDNGNQYARDCRYNYSTIYGNKKKSYFALGTARVAIQEVLMALVPDTKFRDISFLIIDTGREVSKLVEKEDEDEEEIDDELEED